MAIRPWFGGTIAIVPYNSEKIIVGGTIAIVPYNSEKITVGGTIAIVPYNSEKITPKKSLLCFSTKYDKIPSWIVKHGL